MSNDNNSGFNINYSIEKLDGSGHTSNYFFWKWRATQILQEKGVWDGVIEDPTTESGKEKPDKTTPEWKKKDRHATTILIGLIKDSQLKFIANCKSAKEIWDKLAHVHQGIGANGRRILSA